MSTFIKSRLCILPGAGEQYPATEAIQFEDVYVVGASPKAISLDIPILKVKDFWIARSQLCGKDLEDGSLPDIDKQAQKGDRGTVRIPLFIAKKLAAVKTKKVSR